MRSCRVEVVRERHEDGEKAAAPGVGRCAIVNGSADAASAAGPATPLNGCESGIGIVDEEEIDGSKEMYQ